MLSLSNMSFIGVDRYIKLTKQLQQDVVAVKKKQEEQKNEKVRVIAGHLKVWKITANCWVRKHWFETVKDVLKGSIVALICE